MAPPEESMLKITRVIAEPDPTFMNGERLVLNVAIQKEDRKKLNSQNVEVFVYFFETTHGGEPRLTEQSSISQWVTTPVNWENDDSEMLQITYTNEKKAAGCEYHGYVVQVFYENSLQAAQAEPPTLLSRSPGSPSSSEPMLENSDFAP